MGRMTLTDRTVAAASCPPGRKDALVFDDRLKGFGVRITAAGTRSFIFQYRVGDKVRRTVLGTFGTELTTTKARSKAEALRGKVRDKADPVAERRAAQASALQAERATRAAAAAARYTVDAHITQWATLHLAERSASYGDRVPRELRAALAEWRNVAVADFNQADAIRTLDKVKAKRGPVAANRLRAVARACWEWGMKRGSLATNPWSATPKPAREKARERVLTDGEVGALWNSAAALDPPWSHITRLLLLTGQRRGEVAGLRWSELDLDTDSWLLPGERTKNGQTHKVPLASAAVEELRQVKRRRGAELVFEGPRRNVPSGFGKMKDRLNSAMTKAAHDAGRDLADWTIHDIRRTVATGLQRLGVRLEVTEAVLNHVSGSRSGIVGVYQRHGWDAEKAAAMQAWAAYVLHCAGVNGAAEGDSKVSAMMAHRERNGIAA